MSEKEIIEKLKNMKIGFLSKLVVCDLCANKIHEDEDVRILYAKLDLTEKQYKKLLNKLSVIGRVLIVPATTEDIYLCHITCLEDKLDHPTLGTDEWIFKAKLIYENGEPKLVNIESTFHSPSNEGER